MFVLKRRNWTSSGRRTLFFCCHVRQPNVVDSKRVTSVDALMQ